jgi:tRNA nucleotidyltransferase (CCA-adding enzyme)
MTREPNLIDKLTLNIGLPNLVELIEVADELGMSLYLVGGPVRDLRLNRVSVDADVAVEGDARTLAVAFAARVGGRVVQHPAFLTATVKSDYWVLDLTTTRYEEYPHPGALPRARPASIETDLLRRDFTINAMAIRLNGPGIGELIDPAGGVRDLKNGVIRVLHEDSFKDDPTRILRATRYETRFRYIIEPDTFGWLLSDVGHLTTVSGVRLRHEIERILAEAEPDLTLRRLDRLGVLAAIDADLSFDEQKMRGFRAHLSSRTDITPLWPLLVWDLSDAQINRLSHRLALTKRQSRDMVAVPQIRTIENQIASRDTLRSQTAELLDPFPPATIWALVAATRRETVKHRCLDYVLNTRSVRPRLRGDDLIALGVPRGAQLGQVLHRLRSARLDREVTSRDDEERFVRRLGATTGKADQLARQTAPSGPS